MVESGTLQSTQPASSEAGPKDAVVESAGEAIEQVKAVAGEAKQHAMSLLDQTRGELRTQSEQRAQQVSTSLRTLSSQLRGLREGRPGEAGPLQHYLADAESAVTNWARRVEDGGPQAVLNDVRSFARRRPGTFLIAAIGAGFVAGRLARVGAEAAHDSADGAAATANSSAGLDMAPPVMPQGAFA